MWWFSFNNNIDINQKKLKVIIMKKDIAPSKFPQEMPQDNKKPISHGAIVDVVTKEIDAPSAKNPIKPLDTDAVNTEFAKQALDSDCKLTN